MPRINITLQKKLPLRNLLRSRWPLTPDSFFDIEITRWPFAASGTRRAGDKVYCVCVSTAELNPGAANLEVYLQGVRRDDVTKRIRPLAYLDVPSRLIIKRKLKVPLEQLLQAFEKLAQNVLEWAQREQKRYEISRPRALERWSW